MRSVIALQCCCADGREAASLTTYSLARQEERERRQLDLRQPHVASLTEFVLSLRAQYGLSSEIPFFDPLDGGVNAKVLFLLEAPGGKAVASGFISRDNPDPTARNVSLISEEAGLSRKLTIAWNIVPWYVGSGTRIRAVNQTDITSAMQALRELRPLLPDIKVVLLVGSKAQKAKEVVDNLFDVPILGCPHPSQRVFNVWPDKRNVVKEIFAEAARLAAG